HRGWHFLGGGGRHQKPDRRLRERRGHGCPVVPDRRRRSRASDRPRTVGRASLLARHDARRQPTHRGGATVSAPGPDTCVACLTPAGQSALATLGLQGPSAWEGVRLLFRLCNGPTLPASPETGRFWLGRLGADVADEVVLAVKRTGPVPWLEVHCHGGREVVRFLLELFTAHGLRECTWQEFVG